MAGITSRQLEEQHGELLRQAPYSEAASPYFLHKALTKRTPPIAVSHGTVKEWWTW